MARKPDSEMMSHSLSRDQDSNRKVRKKKHSMDIKSTSHSQWNISNQITNDLLDDMGLSMLEEASCDSQMGPTPNPSIPSSSAPPKAPKVSDASKRKNEISELGESPVFSSIKEEFVLFKRRRLEGPLGEDTFSKISDEIIMHIFKWLPKPVLVRCAQVCKRWKRISFDESLWKRLDLVNRHLKPGDTGLVISRGAVFLRLAKADISSPVFTDTTMLQTEERFSKLQYLDLSMAVLSESSLEEILSTCSHLKRLSLEHCTVNNQICRHIGENHELECLNLSMCSGLTAKSLSFIFKGCRSLSSLNVAWTFLSKAAIEIISSNLPESMLYLNLAGMKNEISDENIIKITKRCPDLKELDVSDSSALTGSAVISIIENVNELEHLSMSRCYNIPPANYLLLRNHNSLKTLNIFGLLTESSIKTLIHNLPHIEINKHLFSTVARPTTGIRRTSIWGFRVRD